MRPQSMIFKKDQQNNQADDYGLSIQSLEV